MTIIRSDLVIFKPEQLGNIEQAGGQRTNNPVTSGMLNDLFTPISDIDHAQSAVNIVKCFPTLDTTGTEQLIGSHIFINKPPVDPLVSVIIVESDALNDESRMPEMVDILESSVTPGLLINNAGPGFLPNQNSFPSSYLTAIDPVTDEPVTSMVSTGEVIVITVEYDGVENTTYPRFEHYAKVISVTDLVTFEPAITQATPAPSVIINGSGDRTKIRRVNTISSVIYHGVKELESTAALGATVFNVDSTTQEIVPSVAVQVQYFNQTATNSSGLLRKSISQPAVASTINYIFSTPDILTGTNPNVDYEPTGSFTDGYGDLSFNMSFDVGVDSVSATTRSPAAPIVGTPVVLNYLSTTFYNNYNSVNPFPVDKNIVFDTISGNIDYDGTVLSLIELETGIYVRPEVSLVLAGIMDYETGVFTPSSGLFTNISYQCLVSEFDTASGIQFPLTVANPKLDSFYLRVTSGTGTLMSASSDEDGIITGADITGSIVDGFVSLSFSVPVDLRTLSYDIIDIVRTLPPASIFGIDPLRVPNNGVVPIFHQWGVVAIQHSQFQAVVAPAPAQVKTIRTNARFADITDANNVSLWTPTDDHFTVDLVAGTVTINSNFPGFTAPFVLTDTIGELGLVASLTANTVVVAAPITREYPAGATVASVQILGDLQSIVGPHRTMTSWTGDWNAIGTPTSADLNTAGYPILITNNGAINEDWAIVFTSATAFRLIGKNVGQVATGDTLNDFIPINSVVGQPYFTIQQEAFGAGWNAGEAIRFETFASARPVMLVRVVESGHSSITTDRALISFRGNEA